MIIYSYNQVKSFLAVMQEILEENETANCLMLGALQQYVDNQNADQSTLYLRTAHDMNGLIAAAVRTWPHGLLLYHDQKNYQDAYGMIATDLYNNGHNPPGVFAPREDAQQFAHTWAVLSGMKTDIEVRERLYECSNVRYAPQISGQMREPTRDELPMLVEWAEAMQMECSVPNADPNVKQRIEKSAQSHSIFVWADGSQAVTMAIKTRPIRHTVSISGVYTPPALRKRGYASAVVSTLTQRLLEAGYKTCNLFADLGNPTSNAIYQRIGYIPVIDYDYHRFTRHSLEETRV